MHDLAERLRAALAGRYIVQHEVGRGGMAEVFLAHDARHDRRVAIKVLKPELAQVLGSDRFLREIRLTAQFDHPHILPLLDSGEAGGLLYYVMPYVEGETLRDRLNHDKQLPLDDTLQIVREVADALSYAHSHGIVHRDVKPENILLAGGHARVADFGIARAVTAAGGETLTETGITVGTPAYMSPEQASGEQQLDGRSDIYSLGCVLYEMLGGDPPFTGSNARGILARKSVDEIPRLRSVRETVPLALERAIGKALARVPADRFATATQFAEALKPTADAKESWPATSIARVVLGMRRGLAFGVPLVVVGLGASWIIAGLRARAAELRSIAVLPCDNLTRDTAQAYVADRWTEELIDKLSKVTELRPKSWLSMRQYRDTRKGAPEIAAEVGAGTLVRCRVAETADSLRLRVQIIGAGNDHVLWSHEYDRPLSAIAINTVQTEVAREIAGVLGAAPSPTDRARLDKPLTQDIAALRDYRLARHLHGALTVEGLHRSISYYQRAIARDSLFAAAYVDLADVTLIVREQELRPAREYLPHLEQLVLRALAIDPSLAEARTQLAGFLFYYSHDWPGAEREYQRALQLNPNSATVRMWHGLALVVVAHYEEAIAELEKAVELDPTFSLARVQLISGLRVARRYHRAREEVRAALEIDPENPVVHLHLGLILLQQGHADSAVAELEKGIQLGATSADSRARLGHAYAASGQQDKATPILNELLRSPVPEPISIARLYAGLGNKDDAVRWLERGYQERSTQLMFALGGQDPGFHSLRGDPRFQALRTQVGFDKW